MVVHVPHLVPSQPQHFAAARYAVGACVLELQSGMVVVEGAVRHSAAVGVRWGLLITSIGWICWVTMKDVNGNYP